MVLKIFKIPLIGFFSTLQILLAIPMVAVLRVQPLYPLLLALHTIQDGKPRPHLIGELCSC